LKTDARFATQTARQANREALTQILDIEFGRQPTSYWLDKLVGVLPVAPVFDIQQALENPFLQTTEMIRQVPHPARANLRVLANPLKINGQRLDQAVCSPLGADN